MVLGGGRWAMVMRISACAPAVHPVVEVEEEEWCCRCYWRWRRPALRSAHAAKSSDLRCMPPTRGPVSLALGVGAAVPDQVPSSTPRMRRVHPFNKIPSQFPRSVITCSSGSVARRSLSSPVELESALHFLFISPSSAKTPFLHTHPLISICLSQACDAPSPSNMQLSRTLVSWRIDSRTSSSEHPTSIDHSRSQEKKKSSRAFPHASLNGPWEVL